MWICKDTVKIRNNKTTNTTLKLNNNKLKATTNLKQQQTETITKQKYFYKRQNLYILSVSN